MARPDSTVSHVSALADGVRGLDAVFCCGGNATLPEPVRLRFGNRKTIRVVEDAYGSSSDVGGRLMRQCETAVFGVGTQTRRDPRVRDGGQLLASDGSLKVEGLDQVLAEILEEARLELCPETTAPIAAELHALNVYRRGGHFVRHKDTPRDPDCFGTLVVCLPIAFRGGDLVLHHRTARRFSWQSYWSYSMQESPQQVRWAAFYGDVDHEIEPVTDGSRVTLTWLLRQPRGGAPATHEPASTQADLERQLREALLDREFMSRGGTLGVPCLHLYGETPGLDHPDRELSRDLAAKLRGRDRLVALAAVRVGLEVRFRPYLYENCAQDSWRLRRPPTPSEVAIFQDERLRLYDLEDALPIERSFGWSDHDDVTWILPPPWTSADREAEADPATRRIGDIEYSATGYFGNEGSFTTFYVAAAVLITIPSRPGRSKRPKSTAPADERHRPASGSPQSSETPADEGASLDAIEQLAGMMTVGELCRRTGVTVEALAEFCCSAPPSQPAAKARPRRRPRRRRR